MQQKNYFDDITHILMGNIMNKKFLKTLKKSLCYLFHAAKMFTKDMGWFKGYMLISFCFANSKHFKKLIEKWTSNPIHS